MHTNDAHNLFIRFYSQNTYKIFVQIAFKFILLNKIAHEDFVCILWIKSYEQIVCIVLYVFCE